MLVIKMNISWIFFIKFLSFEIIFSHTYFNWKGLKDLNLHQESLLNLYENSWFWFITDNKIKTKRLMPFARLIHITHFHFWLKFVRLMHRCQVILADRQLINIFQYVFLNSISVLNHKAHLWQRFMQMNAPCIEALFFLLISSVICYVLPIKGRFGRHNV